MSTHGGGRANLCSRFLFSNSRSNSFKKLKTQARTSAFPFLRYPLVQEAAWRSDAEKYIEKKIYPMLEAARVSKGYLVSTQAPFPLAPSPFHLLHYLLPLSHF